MSMARVAAASRRATPNARARRRMPRQDRKPCSGRGLCSRMSSQSAAVADPAHAPFGEDIRLDRQGLERRPVEFVKELPTRDAETADRSLVVEPLEQLTHRRVQLGQTVEPLIA